LLLAALAALASATNAGVAPMGEGLQPANGTELWVKRMGSGEPIVVVHGGPVLDHGYLLPHLAPLSESHELILFDQRLSGRSASEVAESEVNLAAFVEDIEALRVELGLGKIHLMGHSWGGLLAMRYASEHQENLSSLILLDSMAASTKLWKEEEKIVKESVSEEILAEAMAIRQSEELQAYEPDAIANLMRVTFSGQFHDPAKAEQLDFYVPEDYSSRSRQFAALGPELESYDLHEQLSSLSVPVLVLYGEPEPGAGLGGAAIADAISGSELVLIPEAGHFPFVEQPEAFLEAVGSFLRSQPPSALFEHRWRLTHLEGSEVAEVEGPSEPHLILDRRGKRVSGSGGCNRLNGPFELEGEALSFGPIAATRMACPGDEVEMALFGVFEKTAGWRLEGSHLELLDGAGDTLARFEAAALE
jgi:proline iminopeptidase